ncbi:MAG: hypothetical protein Q8O51_00995 [bacterium]|nr:hypothetical protein [bacterium]
MDNLAINITGLLTTAIGIFAFTFLVLAQHRLEQPARSAIRWIAFGVLFGVYSVTRVWLTYAATDVFAGGKAPIQHTYGALMAGALMILIVVPQLIRLRHAKSKLSIRIFATGIICTTLTVGMYGVNFFQPIGFAHVIIMSGMAIAGFIFPGYAAYKLRARYPGTGIEAFIVVGGLFAIIMTIIMMTTTNVSAERAVLNNQSKVVAHLIETQAKQHLTKDAFDPQLTKGQAQLKTFIAEVDVPELHRVKIISADGFIVASDLESLVGTKVLLTGDLERAMKGTSSTVLVKTEIDLPETEKQFGSAQIVTAPLVVSAGQPVAGAVQLFLDAPAAMASINALQNAINFAGIIMIFTIAMVMVVLLRIFRRSISRPFTEILDEIQHIHAETDSGEHRRIKVKHHGDFTIIADTFNRLINEYEEDIRRLKKLLLDRGWHE